MIASLAPGQRWLFVLLVSAFGMTAWQARPAPEAASAEAARGEQPGADPAYRYVPLLGTPLYFAVEDARGDLDDPPLRDPAAPVQTCLPFLAPLMAHPNWQIRIARGSSACADDGLQSDFTISASGAVTWTKPGWPVRHLQLSSEQLALVQRLDRLSCVMQREVPAHYLRSHWFSIGVDFISQERSIDGARVPLQSDLGQALAPMLDQLVAEYLEPRREVVGSVDLRLATTERGVIYRARIADGRLTVSQGRRLLVEEPVAPETLIDLVDAALERRAVAEPAEPDVPDVKGTLLMNGWSVPVAVARRAPGPFAQIGQAIGRAIERAQERGAE